MAFDQFLVDRICKIFNSKNVTFEEKKMMGGLCFMVDGKMCCGVIDDRIMARIDPMFYDRALSIEGCREMDFTGRVMKGFIYVDPIGVNDEDQLEFWITKCLEFNPNAKSSKRKKKTKI